MWTLFLDSHCGWLATDFMPHGHCYFWKPEIVWSHAISDALIAISYFIIPYGLIKLIQKRPDLRYKNLFLLFGLFIVACGTTHILSIINIWEPLYRLDAVVKIITALASVPTAIILLKILPEAVKIPSIQAWEDMNKELHNQILELKEKDKTIEKAREFEFLTNSVPQIIWVADKEGETIYYNDNWFSYTGLSREGAKAWDWTPIIHSDDAEKTLQRWMESVQTGRDYEMEYRLRRASDGQYRWHIAKGVPMRNAHGEIEKWFGMCMDVHDLKVAEEDAKEAKVRLESIINMTPISLWSVNKEGIFTLSEGKALELVGLKPGEIVGKPHSTVFPRPDLGQKIQRALAGESFMAVNDIQNKTFETYYAPLLDDAHGITGMVGISVDVTERKKAETANALKTKFVASMSHELRTPLNAVIGFADQLKKTTLDQEQRHYVELINESGSVLLKLIGEVLDFSKIEEGKMTLELATFHLKENINSSLYPYKFRAQEHGLEFNIVFDNKTPELVVGDQVRLDQILINLVGNALKFTNKGKIEVRVELAGQLGKNAKVRFSVADSGIGIKPEQRDRIFESFTQADSETHRRYGGSGLGLSIAQQLVRLMGGEIHLDSPHDYFQTPIGACFWFEIELEIGQMTDIVPKAPEKMVGFGERVRVLVAEDNQVNQILAKVVLRNIGCEVDFASNGQECIAMMQEHNYACILMDVQMPLMDGIEATTYIRQELKSGIPIIGLSANVTKTDVEKSLQAGMNVHIGKPYTEQQIHRVLLELLPESLREEGQPTSEKVTNLQFIKELIEDKAELASSLQRSLDQAETCQSQLEEHFHQGNFKQIAFLCHSYKSSVRLIGATKLQEALAQMEQAAMKEEQAAVGEILARVKELNERVKSELKVALSNLA